MRCYTGMGILRKFAEFRGICLNFNMIDLFLSFPKNFEFLFYDHY